MKRHQVGLYRTITAKRLFEYDFKEKLMPNDPNLVDLFLVSKSFAAHADLIKIQDIQVSSVESTSCG